MWSKWQSHFGLCGLTICGTASTWDAVTQIEDNKTNRKESDEKLFESLMFDFGQNDKYN